MPTIDKAVALQGVLKEKYPMLMYNTITNHTEILDVFNEASNQRVYDGPDGKYYKLSDLYGGMQGIGSRLENAYLPEGGTPLFINPLVKLKFHYARIDATYQAIANAVSGEAAFADFGASVLLPAVEALTDDLDRQACGFGSGILCRVDDASPDTTLGLDAPFGIASDTKAWLNVKAGQKLVFSPNADGSALRAGGTPATVSSVDPGANGGGGIATIDALPTGVADNDYVFRGDQYGTNIAVGGEEPELMGLEGMIDDGTVLDTLQNVSRTTVAEWKSTVISASAAPYSGAFTEGLMLKGVTDARTVAGGRPDLVVCSHDVGRQAFNAIRGLGGFGAGRDGNNVKAGYKGVSIDTPMGTIELRSVSRVAPGRAYWLDRSTFCRFKNGNGEWVDQFGGSMWHQQAAGGAIKDAGFAYFRVPLQLACTNPRKSAKATGLSETAY